jgi:wobble nucleotide-excising tRNase
MKIDITIQLRNFQGVGLKDEKEEALTVKKVLVSALLNQTTDKIGNADKYQCYQLSKKIEEAETEVELISDEVSNIKKLIEKFFGVMIVGQVFDVLEGKVESLPELKEVKK